MNKQNKKESKQARKKRIRFSLKSVEKGFKLESKKT